MRLLHPIRTWREMRTRSKAIAGGIGGLLIIPIVAFAAALLTSASPFSGTVHNGSWAVNLTNAATIPDTSSMGGAPGAIMLPTDTTQSVLDALGDPANNT